MTVSTEEGNTIVAICDSLEDADDVAATIKNAMQKGNSVNTRSQQSRTTDDSQKFDEQNLKETYRNYISAREKCKQPVENLSFEKFKNALVKKYANAQGGVTLKAGIRNGKAVINSVAPDSSVPPSPKAKSNKIQKNRGNEIMSLSALRKTIGHHKTFIMFLLVILTLSTYLVVWLTARKKVFNKIAKKTVISDSSIIWLLTICIFPFFISSVRLENCKQF